MFSEKPKRKTISINIKKKVFERSNGMCENPKCRKPLRWGSKGAGTVRGRFHHVGDPSKNATSKTVRFLCPNCHDLAHEYKTVKKETYFGTITKERKVIRKSFISIGNNNKSGGKQMVSYTCKRSVSDRIIYCGKKKASKACLTYSLNGTKCPYLTRSLK